MAHDIHYLYILATGIYHRDVFIQHVLCEKSWHQTVTTLHAQHQAHYRVSYLCVLFGVTKQAYYNHNDELFYSCMATANYIPYNKTNHTRNNVHRVNLS